MALVDIGLSGQEFGRNTHRTLGALMDRVKFNRQLEDFRAGQICSMIAASVGGTFSPADFFPGLRVKEAVDPKRVRAIFRDIQAMNR